MAIAGSQGARLMPFRDQPNDITPQRVDMLQTSTSGATAGSMQLVGSATVTNEFRIVSYDISVTNPTATAYIDFVAGGDILATFPTVAAGVTQHFSHNYGSLGLMVGTTTTYTAEVFVRTATATVRTVLTGYRNV